MEFLVRGITQFDEPGVFLAFEESADDLISNVASLGFDLAQFVAEGQLVIDHINLGEQMEETGEWDLEGLFVRLGAAIDLVGAKRVVIDTIETLFGAFSNTAILRRELRRLFGWLKDREVTAVITGERGDGTLTRYGIEEYVSDCVIILDHRVTEQTSTRRLRILKYRGLAARDQRVPVPDRRIRRLGAPDHVARPPAHRLHRTGVDRRGPSRRHARQRRLLEGKHGPRQRHGRHRQVDAGRAVLRCRMPPWRPGDLLRLRGIRGRNRAEHDFGRYQLAAMGGFGPLAVPVLPTEPARPRISSLRDAEVRGRIRSRRSW